MSGPAKDRRRTGAATRVDILEAAKRLLATGASVAQLRVDGIVREAGMSRATFYLHFADKNALVAALAKDQLAWRDEIAAGTLADWNLQREALDRMIREIVARWAENRTVLSAIVEVAEYDSAIGETWRQTMNEVAETAGAAFARRWQDRSDGPRDPRTVAELFTWMFERGCHQILRDPARQDAVAEGMAEIIWRTLTHHS